MGKAIGAGWWLGCAGGTCVMALAGLVGAVGAEETVGAGPVTVAPGFPEDAIPYTVTDARRRATVRTADRTLAGRIVSEDGQNVIDPGRPNTADSISLIWSPSRYR